MYVMSMKKYVTDINNELLFEEVNINEPDTINEVVEVNDIKSRFDGMGGALTQASNINYNYLNLEQEEDFLKSYFEDLKYKFLRLPIGSCDFSPISYDYLNHKKFDIGEDKLYIQPLLKDIMQKYNLTYIASPWSPPNKYKNLFGTKLSKKRYEDYANYLVDYIKYYKDFGIDIKYLSIQNEPYALQKWESCLFNANEQKDFINILSSKLDDNTFIMLHDHNKKNLCNYIDNTYMDNEKIKAIAFHWYDGSHFDELDKVHNKYPNLKLIESEMCCGYSPYNFKKWLKDAELYGNEIIGNLNNYMNIYMDWNLLLDEFGGPNHKHNYVKAPMMYIENELVKTPIYYYLKHISLHQDSNIYDVKSNKLKVLVSDKYITIMNDTKEDISFSVLNIKDTIYKHTIVTYKKEA